MTIDITNEKVQSVFSGNSEPHKLTSAFHYDLPKPEESAGELIAKGFIPGNMTSLVKGIEKATGADLSGLRKAAAVIDFVPSKLDAGFLGAVEGITDFIAGGAAQIVGQKDAAKWIYEHSWSRELSGTDAVDDELGGSKGYQIASDIISGIGNVGFQVAVGYALGGALQGAMAAGKIGAVGAKAVQYAPLFLSASGQGTAEAVQKTGNVGWKENLAGLGSGAIEVATEIVSPTGRIADRALYGTAKDMGKTFGKHAIVKGVISSFAGEAGEEAASYWLNLNLQRGLGISEEEFSWREMGYQALIGGITGAIFAAPTSAYSIHQAQKAGANVYAQGEQAVADKINQGKVVLKEMERAGLNNDARYKESYELASRALAELEADAGQNKLTAKQKALRLGLSEQAVLSIEMRSQADAIAEVNAERAKNDPAYAQQVADAFNAIVKESGGESNYTAADFTDPKSTANQAFAVAKLFERIVTPMPNVETVRAMIQQGVSTYANTAEQTAQIKNLEDQGVLVYKTESGAYAIITKRKGDGTYSIAFTTAKNVADDTGSWVLGHGLTAEQVGEYAKTPLTESDVQNMIKAAEEEKIQRELLGDEEYERAFVRKTWQTEQTTEKPAQETEKPKPKRKPKTAQAQTVSTDQTAQTAAEPGEANLSPSGKKKQRASTKKTTSNKKTAKTETTTKKVTVESLSEVESRLTIDLGIDRSEFTGNEWAQARKAVPNIDGLSEVKQADILLLVRTANAANLDKTYIEGLCRISAGFGVTIMFDANSTVKGFEVKDGGSYVVINPANVNDTYGHELTHSFYGANDKAAQAKLVERVRKTVGAEAFDKAKAQYAKDYEAQFKRQLSAEKMDEEATASVIGNYLSDMSLLRRIAARDGGIGRRLLESVRAMKSKWVQAKAFAKENNSTTFAEYRKMTRIENLLMKELGWNKQYGTGRDGVAVDRNGNVSFNVATYNNKIIKVGNEMLSGREILERKLRQNGYSEADIKATLEQLDTISKKMEELGKNYQYLRDWNDKGLEYNLETGGLVFTSLVKNGEYEINFDFTTVCKHREAFTKVLEELVRMNKAEEIVLTAQRIVEINTILTKHDLQTACTMCFVESRRNNIRKWAISFIDGKPATKKVAKRMGWNDIVRSVYGKDVGYADFSQDAPDGNAENVDIDSASDMMKMDMATDEDLAEILEEREAAEENPEEAAKNTEEKLKRLIKSDKKYAFLLRESDLYGTVGVSAIKRQFPEMYSILLQSYGVATPKITLPAAPYASELETLKKGKKSIYKGGTYKTITINGNKENFTLGEYTKMIGGARLQSFSDYQMLRFFDYCQLIADAQANGIAIQCYTKEIDMVHLFGLTGMKINMSLVPYVHNSTKALGKDYAGLIRNADGTFDYAIAKESIPYRETYTEKGVTKHGAFWYQNQEGYKNNVGTILIGVSKYQILKALADPNIRMVIPYHASGMAKGLQMAYHIDGFEDYTFMQHTRKKGENGKYVNVSKAEEFNFYEAYRRLNGDAKAACQEYLDYCKKNDFLPKFFDYGEQYEGFVYNKDGTMNENYYKLIEDFSCYDGDGNIIQQGAVSLTLPSDWLARVEAGLVFAGEENAKLQREMKPILDEIQEVAKTGAKKEKTYKQLGEEYYEAKQKQYVPGVSEPSDTSFSPAPVSPSTDSEYMQLAQEPKKNESRLRELVEQAANAAGFDSPLLYHGTNAYGFTSVDPSAPGGDSYSFWASNSKTTSATYTQYGEVREIGSELTEEQVEQMVDKRSEDLDDTIRDFCALIDKHFSEWFFGYDGGTNTVRTIVERANPESGNGDGVYDELLDLVGDAYDSYGDEYQSEYEEFADWQEHSKEFEEIEQAIIDVEGAYSALRDVEANGVVGGIYQLYANLDNMLVIEGNGAAWNNLHPDNLPKLERYGVKDAPYTTRDVAKWAKNNGYDGVIFKNIKDNGQYGRTPASDVYSFFKPKAQVKSADPVTYDNDGNVIPLSQRYNRQMDELRYSPAEPQRRVVTRAQMPKPWITEKITNAKGQLNRRGLKNALDNASSAWESFKIVTVNAQQALENQLIRGGMTKRQAAAWSQLARTGRLHANNAIGYALADMTGEVRSDGLMKIITPFLAQKGEVYKAWDENQQKFVDVTAKGGELAGKRYDDFSDYLAMLNAIDRAKVGKNPYSDMTVGQMQKIVAEYEKANPDFKAASEQFSQYNNVMLDILVQSGMVSQKLADEFRKKYPHYIPMRTADSTPAGSGAIRGSENLEVKRGLRTAEESNHRVDDPIKNYITQVESRIKAAKLNMLAIEIYETADGENVVRGKDSRATAKELREMERKFLEDPLSMPDPTELFRKFQTGDNTRNEITFYKDGKMLTMAVSDRIYTGFTDLAGQHSAILDSGLAKLSKKINDTFKKLVTNWNPFFAVRNIARDLQDGLLQTQYGFFEFQQMYLKNAQMMASGKFNDLWVEFVANGGLESSLFSDEFATYTIGGKSGLEQAHGVVGQFQHIKNFNTLTEALPRFTEYCLTRKHGGSVQTALLNAADVTVNFGRGGTLTKILNSTVSPFLNPAVQGLDRVVRLFTENGLRNNKALASLLLKAFLLGILPMVLSNAMYGGDKEYEDMKDNVKENNYLFKIGNTWLKIPRGRVVSTISGLYNRSSKQATGQYVDWKDYGKNVLDQITPAQNVARHIASPFMDVANNKTWYGSAIESQSLQNYAVKDRYDENTSRIAVWIGQFTSHFGYSPKKVHYLLDQYTGVVGDILLPATTPAGSRGVVAYNFTVDANTSSNLSDRFYKVYNDALYASNAGDEEAYFLKKRLDETKSAASELFKEIKSINADSSLSNKEKVKQASAIRAMINQLYKTAVLDAKEYSANVKDAMAVKNSYGVVQITQKNAKQYGLTSADAGKYAVTFGEQVVKLYGSEGEATGYMDDTARKTVYAEANRLTYGSEYALKEYNSNVYEKAKKLNELGISYDEYYNYYMTVRYYSGKDKKQKILAYLNGSGMTKSQIALMMYYSGYTGYAEDAKKAIRASSLSAERKKELLAEIGK